MNWTAVHGSSVNRDDCRAAFGSETVKAQVLGWYNQQNVGDEAFKLAFLEGFRLLGEPVNLRFSTQRAPEGSSVILGGGDVIKSAYIEKLLGKDAIFPIGVGLGYESEAELLKKLPVPIAVVRNLRDVEVLGSIGLSAEYCPDITFVLPVPSPSEEDRTRKTRKRLGVLLSDEVNPTFEENTARLYMYYEYFKWELAAILDELSEYYEILFVPFSTLDSIDDRKMNGDIFRRMSKRHLARLEDKPLSVVKARELIASCDLVVTMKYHGLLFAVQAGVPFVNIGETRKTQLFCQENGLQALSVPRLSLERERFLSFVKVAESGQSKSQIRTTGDALRSKAREVLPRALERVLKCEQQSEARDRLSDRLF